MNLLDRVNAYIKLSETYVLVNDFESAKEALDSAKNLMETY